MEHTKDMKILDATASTRSIWYQKNNPFVVFLDIRKGKYIVGPEIGSDRKNWRTCLIKPHIQAKWQFLPFKNNSFDIVIFDPPHFIKRKHNAACTTKYGTLNNSWREDIRQASQELFRVLKLDGTFILKWHEADIKTDEILKLLPFPPLFGSQTGQKNKTHWILFLKHRFELPFEELC